MAGERGTDPSMLEKDYVLGWILYGISESSIGQRLAFKGGTASLQGILSRRMEVLRGS